VVVPTLKRSTTVELDKSVTWDSIAGVGDVKQTLREAVEWPLVHADAFRAFGIGAPRGILLYGPPGCSKTMLATRVRQRDALLVCVARWRRDLLAVPGRR
jgi:SpoVK/Ycf46/Vps4 family AAA+-type ATPase